MNLSFPISENIAGLEAFYFVEVEHVYQDTGREILLSGNNIWNVGKATKFTPNFKDRLRTSQKGNKIPVTLSGNIAKKSQALNTVLKKMLNRYYIVIYRDLNGQFVRVGSKNHPLKFSYSGNTGKRPGSFAGISFTFSGTLLELPEPYYGIIPTDGGQVNQDQLPLADPVVVRWNEGNVIAVLNPGQTLLLKSEFEVPEFQVL